MALGTRLFFSGRASLAALYNYLFFPMDSTRYIEFDEVWKRLKGYSFSRYLDVSSPRLMPLLLLKANPRATGTLLNPDDSDLQETKRLADSLNVTSRCEFQNTTLQEANLSIASFDLITCISVLEHIPEDKAALQIIWSLLRPGGKLILTIPAMAQPLEQHISNNPYGVLRPGDDGYTFWQRYYDRERLESTIYAVTGAPVHTVLYGEIKRGLFFRNATMKRVIGGTLYPFWREPYMMATEYQIFDSPDKLPGEGVVMLEFIKQ
jgi:SAM-dependent methyltransferase